MRVAPESEQAPLGNTLLGRQRLVEPRLSGIEPRDSLSLLLGGGMGLQPWVDGHGRGESMLLGHSL
jgi:hypothetical protein